MITSFIKEPGVTKLWPDDLIYNIFESRDKILLVVSWTEPMAS